MGSFDTLLAHFRERDSNLVEVRGTKVFDTSHGIFGTSDLRDLFQLFQDIGLDAKEGFVDLGSGDGRVALLASLFTKSIGIEADKDLHLRATASREALLQAIPATERCTLIQGDYTHQDLRGYDVFFIYADHAWDERFEAKLRACGGILFSHQNIFAPKTLKKGKTFWVGQTPFVSYLLG